MSSPSSLDRLRTRADRELSDTSLNLFRGPLGRWVALSGWFAAVAALVAATWMDQLVLSGVLVFVVLGAARFLGRVVRSMADLPEWLLHDRMEGVRNRAYRSAYTGLVTIVAAALAALWIASEAPALGFVLEGHHVAATLGLVLGLALGLPSAVVALTVRDL